MVAIPMIARDDADALVTAAVAKERAACAALAAAEAEHQQAIYRKLPGTQAMLKEREIAIGKVATAQRIERAIKRGNR